MKVTSVVSVTIKEYKSPIHEDYRGMYLLAALPNQAGRKKDGGRCTSYLKPYLVHSAIYSSPKDTERFISELQERGFYSFDVE